MGKLIINLSLIIITGFAFIWSYQNLIDSIRTSHTKEALFYLSQNQAIDDLQSKYPKSLTISKVKEYDQKHGTQISLAVSKASSMQMSSFSGAVAYHEPDGTKKVDRNLTTITLGFLKAENSLKADEITDNKNDFLSYLPPFPTLLFGGTGIFFGTLITKLGNTCYKKLPYLLEKCWPLAIIIILVCSILTYYIYSFKQ